MSLKVKCPVLFDVPDKDDYWFKFINSTV
jgi:hypothetical protein